MMRWRPWFVPVALFVAFIAACVMAAMHLHANITLDGKPM